MKSIKYLALTLLFVACSRVPITGRRQVHMLPEKTLMSLSLTQYRSFLNQSKIVGGGNTNSTTVKNVGQRLANAARQYLIKHGQGARVKNFKWEFNLVDDPLVNAWCMPGGKAVVYSGILPVTQDETGLAVVLGHEIAHAIARHGNERMSQGLMAATGGLALNIALSQQPELVRNLLLQSYGIGSTLGMLKYSRTHETEADKMGLVFMAMAGYDPREAVNFWNRMGQQGGTKPPEILSTHPHDDTRAKTLREFMPTAMKYYKPK